MTVEVMKMYQMLKKAGVIMMAVIMLASIFMLSAPTVAQAKTIKPTKMAIKCTAYTVDIGGKVQASVKSVSPVKASKAVTWKSSNSKIAKISSKGVITGVKAGKVTITATSKYNKKLKKSFKITVKNLVIKKLKLSKSALTITRMNGNASYKLRYITTPRYGLYTKGVTWKSSKTAIASVSKTGNVVAKAVGTCTITATSKDNKKIKATCKLKVVQGVTALSFASPSIDLAKGATYRQAATVAPANATNPAVSYISSNPAAAAVAADGTVTATGVGVATIMAIAADGNGANASYTVNVYDKVTPTISGSNSVYTIPANAAKIEIKSDKGTGTFTPTQINNMFGSGSMGTDFFTPSSVSTNFVSGSVDMSLGDYMIAKTAGSNVVKIAYVKNGSKVTTNWNFVAAKSFAQTANGYTLTVFEKADGTGSSKTLTLAGNALSFSYNGSTVNVVKIDANTVTVTKGAYTMTISKSGSGFAFTFATSDVAAHGISLTALAK